LLVILRDWGCDIEVGEKADGVAMSFTAPEEALVQGAFLAVLGRIAIGGPVEQEDAGVEIFNGEAADVGVDTELRAS
jgi:energy-converting hydrogenase Eha subunit E